MRLSIETLGSTMQVLVEAEMERMWFRAEVSMILEASNAVMRVEFVVPW